jgi:curved DNA-binding protein CbpA
MASFRTHYQNLKIDRTANQRLIKAAHKALAYEYHPDKNPGDAEAERIMKIIQHSYDVLSDPEARKKHDEWIAREEAKAENRRREQEKQEKEQRHKEEMARKTASRKNKGDTTIAFDVDIDRKHFAKALNEIETGNKQDGLWAMAYANTKNKDDTEKEYINLRAQELHKQEIIRKKKAKKKRERVRKEKQAEAELARRREERRQRKAEKEKEAELARKREERRQRKAEKEKEAELARRREERRQRKAEKEKETAATTARVASINKLREERKETKRLRAEQRRKEKEAEAKRYRAARTSYEGMQQEFKKKGIKLKKTFLSNEYKIIYQDGNVEILYSWKDLEAFFDQTFYKR